MLENTAMSQFVFSLLAMLIAFIVFKAIEKLDGWKLAGSLVVTLSVLGLVGYRTYEKSSRLPPTIECAMSQECSQKYQESLK